MTSLDERTRQQYLLEKKLVQRIVASRRENRTRVMAEAYDELFVNVPWHPQLDKSREQLQLSVKQLLFEHLLGRNMDILDIGAGTAYWTRYLAHKTTGRCVAVDISRQVLTRQPGDPSNLELYIMTAVELGFSANSFDMAFSSQLIEHLHPEDIELHFASVYRVLKTTGLYAFDTPSRLNGPHDVSALFDDVATGLHLKEWTYRELADYLRKAGFAKIRTMIFPWGLVKRLPCMRPLGTHAVSLLIPGERLVESIKHKRMRFMLCKCLRVGAVYIIAGKEPDVSTPAQMTSNS